MLGTMNVSEKVIAGVGVVILATAGTFSVVAIAAPSETNSPSTIQQEKMGGTLEPAPITEPETPPIVEPVAPSGNEPTIEPTHPTPEPAPGPPPTKIPDSNQYAPPPPAPESVPAPPPAPPTPQPRDPALDG